MRGRLNVLLQNLLSISECGADFINELIDRFNHIYQLDKELVLTNGIIFNIYYDTVKKITEKFDEEFAEVFIEEFLEDCVNFKMDGIYSTLSIRINDKDWVIVSNYEEALRAIYKALKFIEVGDDD